jgi:hypothetical protein
MELELEMGMGLGLGLRDNHTTSKLTTLSSQRAHHSAICEGLFTISNCCRHHSLVSNTIEARLGFTRRVFTGE